MLHILVAGALVASSLLAPLPAASSTESDTFNVPISREELGIWYTLKFDKTCPDSHPFVHTDRRAGTLPEHVTFMSSLKGSRWSPATGLVGHVTNWNFEKRYVSLDLKCTSDPARAAIAG